MQQLINTTSNFLLNQLMACPQRFNFFQAVRLLENHGVNGSRQAVKFSVNPSLQFSAGNIAKLYQVEHYEQGKISYEFRLWVNFIGLIGENGVLPSHYTELLLRNSRNKDYALQEFLDIFQHRIIQCFYRSWKKYHLPVNYEIAQLTKTTDPITHLIYSLLGKDPDVMDENPLPHNILLFYAGHFHNHTHSAISLQQILSGYLRLPAEINQFQGEWLKLDSEVCARISNSSSMPANNALGVNMLIGSRAWQCQNKFRIKLGPLTKEELFHILPNKNNDTLKNIIYIVRRFIDAHLTFDLQLVVKHDEVPCLQLNSAQPPRLGFDTWLFKQQFDTDVEDVILNETIVP